MGFRSRFGAFLLSVAVLVTAAPASASEYMPYHRLRQLFPQVDRAVASLPSSDLHGSFNRISAILSSKDFADLQDGSSAQVPANVERRLVAAIDQLRARLGDDLDALAPEDRLALLQTIAVVVFEPVDALHADSTWEFCPDPTTGCNAPAPLSALDRLAQDLVPVISGLVLDYEAMAAGDPSLPAGPGLRPDEDYNSQTYSKSVDELTDVWSLVHGEPSIDY
jgi:hypothetical protein